MSTGALLTLREARELALILMGDLSTCCTRVEIAGSIRRGKPFVHDIELVCIPRFTMSVPDTDLMGEPVSKSVPIRHPGFEQVVKRYAATIVKGKPREGRYVQFITRTGVKVDLFTATTDNWGYIFALRTGSVEYSKGLASRWVKLGYRGDDGMLHRSGKPVPIREEKDLYQLLDLKWIHPSERG